MGNGIAQVFAQAGFTVRVQDVAQAALDRARAGVEKSLAKFVEKGKLQAADRDAALGRIHMNTSLDSLSDADYVVEAAAESFAVKKTIFAALGMHFMNPVPLMTLVELIRGQATSADTMAVASDLCRKLGKTPVEAADYPGFIANRILMPISTKRSTRSWRASARRRRSIP
jgi:3-hydroxybutyryl-CoA dehydrogenase